MRYLFIPLKLLQFWYPESLVFFLRVWKNLLLYLEEDLAVGLMFKLLFIPLFHDSTVVGRILSFFFRSFRIFLGLAAFLLVTATVLTLGVFWFLLPILAFLLIGNLGWVAKGLLFSGIVLFLNHFLSHPPKQVWQIHSISEIWQASLIKKKDTGLLKLLKTPSIKNLLLYLEKNPDQFVNFVQEPTEEVWQKVLDLGRSLKVAYLGTEHFFVAELLIYPKIENELMKLGLKKEDFINVLRFFKKRVDEWRMVPVWDENFRVQHLRGINRGWLGIPTPCLDAVSEDLTRRAIREQLPDFIGRQEIVAQIINILSLENGRNVVIVGDVGAGRGALVGYLVKRIIAGDAPVSLATKRLVRLDFTKLLAGIKSQGELAERIKNVFDEVIFSGNIIIFIDEVQNLGIGEANSEFNLYFLMLPFIESSNTQFITTTEPANYVRILEKNTPFARLFARVDLPPATLSETVEILQKRAVGVERHKKIKTSLLAISEIARLSAEMIHDRVLPDSALHVFAQCQVEAENDWIKKAVVDKVVQTQVKIPIIQGKETKLQVLNLEGIIHKRLIDQEEAVSVVVNTLKRAAANLRDQKRPIGSFLFVGPTGVGKTELAKILSEEYFLGRGNFSRFDMSEYQTVSSIDRLIGGSNETGQLTESIRQNPYTLILLDEFEKADPKILTLFLQVLEDGRLTDGTGKTIDFTNTIIIATSNAGSLIIAQSLTEDQTLKEIENQVKEELLKIFKPELINRFDGVVLFKPLKEDDLEKIVRLKLFSLEENLKEQGFIVEFDEGLVKALTEKGYDKVLGARPLRRLIQDSLETKLSVLILEGKLLKGEKFMVGEQILT